MVNWVSIRDYRYLICLPLFLEDFELKIFRTRSRSIQENDEESSTFRKPSSLIFLEFPESQSFVYNNKIPPFQRKVTQLVIYMILVEIFVFFKLDL